MSIQLMKIISVNATDENNKLASIQLLRKMSVNSTEKNI